MTVFKNVHFVTLVGLSLWQKGGFGYEYSSHQTNTNTTENNRLRKAKVRTSGKIDKTTRYATNLLGNALPSTLQVESQNTVLTVPPNNDVANALPLQFGIPIDFNTANADVEIDEPNPGYGSSEYDIYSCESQDGWCPSEDDPVLFATLWYSFQAPPSTTCVSIVTKDRDPTMDTQLALWHTDTPTDFSTYLEVAANDDVGLPFQWAKIEKACVTPGKDYLIQLDPYNKKVVTGTITLEKEWCKKCCPLATQDVSDPLCVERKKQKFSCVGLSNFSGTTSMCGITKVTPVQYNIKRVDSRSGIGNVIRSNVAVSSINVNAETVDFFADNCTEDSVFLDEANDMICFQLTSNEKDDLMINVQYTVTDIFDQTVSFERLVHVASKHGPKRRLSKPLPKSFLSTSSSPSSSLSPSSSPSSSSAPSSLQQHTCTPTTWFEADYNCVKKI